MKRPKSWQYRARVLIIGNGFRLMASAGRPDYRCRSRNSPLVRIRASFFAGRAVQNRVGPGDRQGGQQPGDGPHPPGEIDAPAVFLKPAPDDLRGTFRWHEEGHVVVVCIGNATFHETRAYDGNPDTAGFQLAAQSIAVGQNRGLACGVGGCRWQATIRGHGTHDRQLALTASAHAGDCG